MPDLTRRDFMKNTALAAAALQLPAALRVGGETQPADTSATAAKVVSEGVELRWLDGGVPALSTGTTLGVPWPRGAFKPEQPFVLHSANGGEIPLQSWPLAYWPDGSLKWSGHAVGVNSGLGEKLYLLAGEPQFRGVPEKVTVNESADAIEVDTSVIRCRIAKRGGVIIESITRDGREIACKGVLICLRQNRAEGEGMAVEQQPFFSEISAVTVEQKGPVRAVVKIEGRHTNSEGRAWLPFVLRLYFYAAAESVRVMHTIVFDGDENKDFIRGLGLHLRVPIQGELHDRHVRFAGEGKGLWAEATRTLTGLRRDPGKAFREAQIAGQACPPVEQLPAAIRDKLQYIPAFGDFSLFQPTADSFEIRKRTKEGWTWLDSGYGKRAAGLGYVGSPTGGVAFGIRNFWQSHPSGLDIEGATGDEAGITLWLWSPEARPMDMRFYHDGLGMDTYEKQRAGLDITYEDYEPGFGTAVGVARTSELMIWALPATPSRERLVVMADALRKPPQLVTKPDAYHTAQVFGGAIWSLPDRSTPVKKRIEEQLDWFFDYYQKQVEQHHWYGFWNYGDFMHTYDTDRHVWRYDVGGYAWANSELSPDIWLWYAFLRSGRADIFRMAEAMTRHTGEVDVYHLGRFAGLGTRHGVVHWGDSAKQLRISTAENRRFFYYLTADERVGDLMRELLDADRKAGEIPPGRKLPGAKPSPEPGTRPYSMEFGVGTDFGAISSAWLTEWERTGNTMYRDKLLNGMKTIATLPHGWLSGGGGYDPETGKFFPTGQSISAVHLSVVFGGFEVNAELLQLLDVPEYEQTWLQYCELYNASRDEQIKAVGQELGKLNLQQAHSRLTAYAGWKKKDPELLKRAWAEFFKGQAGYAWPWPSETKRIEGPAVLNPVEEHPWISTNATAQWGLTAIQVLALAGDYAPEQLPPSK